MEEDEEKDSANGSYHQSREASEHTDKEEEQLIIRAESLHIPNQLEQIQIRSAEVSPMATQTTRASLSPIFLQPEAMPFQ